MLTENQKFNLHNRSRTHTTGPSANSYKLGLVGAFYNADSPTGFFHPDETLFDDIVRVLFERGYALPSNFDPSVINIHKNHGAFDYMGDDGETFDTSAFLYVRRVKTEKDVAQSDSDHTASSPHELKKDAWLNGAIRRQSKIIITHGTSKEVTSREFTSGILRRSPYRLIYSEAREFKGNQKLPGAKLEVMIHRDMK